VSVNTSFSKLRATLGLVLLVVLNASGQEAAAPQQNGHEQSVAELRRCAEAGDAEAQYTLAVRYSSGHGVPQNDAEALTWFRKSADSGHAMGQVTLGLIYREGSHGVKKNPEQAVDWFRKAASQGNPNGQSELGFMYERGEGLPQDDREAVRWYALAAAQGLPVAQFDLAYMYENGNGVASDPQKALELYESAAVSIPTARHNLAVIYFNGKLVHKDLVLAYKWALLAVSAEFVRILHEGRPDPEPRLGHALIFARDVAKHMSKDEKKSARSMAEQWINSNAARLGEEPRFFPGSIEHLK
jgi:TPR repeat protein